MYSSPSRKCLFPLEGGHECTDNRRPYSAAVNSWVERYSNNSHRGFKDIERAEAWFNDALVEGEVQDKFGRVSAMVDGKPVYVPGTAGATLLAIPVAAIPSPLPAPY